MPHLFYLYIYTFQHSGKNFRPLRLARLWRHFALCDCVPFGGVVNECGDPSRVMACLLCFISTTCVRCLVVHNCTFVACFVCFVVHFLWPTLKDSINILYHLLSKYKIFCILDGCSTILLHSFINIKWGVCLLGQTPRYVQWSCAVTEKLQGTANGNAQIQGKQEPCVRTSIISAVYVNL